LIVPTKTNVLPQVAGAAVHVSTMTLLRLFPVELPQDLAREVLLAQHRDVVGVGVGVEPDVLAARDGVDRRRARTLSRTRVGMSTSATGVAKRALSR